MRKKSDRHESRQGGPDRPSSWPRLSARAKRLLRKAILWTVAAGALASFVFLDSHSLLKRMTWRSEYLEVREDNEKLRRDIAELEKEVSEGLSDEAVEKIAREEYGMRRPGETVYPVATPDDARKDDPDASQRAAAPESPAPDADGRPAGGDD